jgi:hypothetical protein
MSEAQKRTFRVSTTVSVAKMSEGAVLMDRATGECFELNRIGAMVWERLARGEDIDRTVGQIASDCSAQRSAVSADTAKLVDELTRRGILIAAP